ncbi:MAG: hypothetical protein KDE33_11560 [Bacteroidetes bacterium]|nr:hypothetical protein [Bacteroidota bacterium]MCB9227377.1 hypothetical protein [Chitinophagales bacterium]
MQSTPILILVFLISATIIWYCSNKLSDVVDYIDDAYKLGAAFGGTIILSIATNLPELSIVVQGVMQKDTSLAIGNILGGIAMQTLLLSLFDFAARKRDKLPLTSLVSPIISIMQGLFLTAILAMVILGTQFNKSKLSPNFPVAELFIGFAWLFSLYLLHKSKQKASKENEKEIKELSTKFTKKKALVLLFIFGSAIFVFGYLLGHTSDLLADKFHMNGVIFGATILAFVTSLPEISGGLAFVKQRNYQPIISDIFGGNTFLPVLFLIASFLNHFTLLPDAEHSDIYLTSLSIILCSVYMIGMALHSKKRYLGMGLDSWIAVIVYVIGIACLTLVA